MFPTIINERRRQMPEIIIDIGDPKTGRTYHIVLGEDEARNLYGRRIGDLIPGELIGFEGYKFQITGGTDKDGFPMHPSIMGPGRKRVLLSKGPGYRPREKGIRRRKLVRGNTVSPDIKQLNLKIVEWGEKPIVEEKESKDEPAETA